MTAWLDIVTRVLPSPDIYEFDLKGFFDSVNQRYLRKLLNVRCKLEVDEYKFIARLMNNLPELPKEQQLDETRILKEQRGTSSFTVDLKFGLDSLDLRHIGGRKRRSEAAPIPPAEPLLNPFANKETKEGMQHYKDWFAANRPLYGVPQGVAFSPILSLLALERTMFPIPLGELNQSGIECVMYADDGVKFGSRLPDDPVKPKFPFSMFFD